MYYVVAHTSSTLIVHRWSPLHRHDRPSEVVWQSQSASEKYCFDYENVRLTSPFLSHIFASYTVVLFVSILRVRLCRCFW